MVVEGAGRRKKSDDDSLKHGNRPRPAEENLHGTFGKGGDRESAGEE